MVNRHERKKLRDGFEREPLSGATVTIKCAAGLLVVAGLAIGGPHIDTAEATFAAAAGLMQPLQTKESLTHAKALYHQRQIRFAPTRPGVVVEIPPMDPDRQLNLNVGAERRAAELMHRSGPKKF